MQSYKEMLRHILTFGYKHEDRTGVGTWSVFGYQWEHKLVDGFPLLTTKQMPFRWIAAELQWFLSGSTNNNDLMAMGVDIWKEWADENGDLGHIYGGTWRNFLKLPENQLDIPAGNDQIATLMEELANNPNSRRLLVTAWHPVEARKTAIPGCHTLFQLKYLKRFNRLDLHLYMRSADAFLGVPFNIASYALLLVLICHLQHMVPGRLIVSFGDLHIYMNHMQAVSELLSRHPFPLPHVEIDPGDQPFNKLEDFQFKWAKLTGYKPHGKIDAPVAV